jgi:4'-phosphopantetheinyl transferase
MASRAQDRQLWQLPPVTFELVPGETHLWWTLCVEATLDVTSFAGWLTPGEIARAERLATENLRRRYLQAHSLLHTLLAAYLQTGAQSCELANDHNGKPYLVTPQLQPRLEFNLSHAGDLVVIALARGHAVGVDVEWLRPLDDLEGLTKATCSAREQRYLAALNPAARTTAFYQLWTRKEAWVKLRGTGLREPLPALEVDEPPVSITLADLPLADVTEGEYVGALALPVGTPLAPPILQEAHWLHP